MPAENVRGLKCVREGKPVEEEGVEEDRKGRKREGNIFILQHHNYLSCCLGICMFCWYSNGPDGTELKAEMKSSLMARQRTDG